MDEDEVFTVSEKGYRETRLNSGIPPPSLRDRAGSRHRDQQRYDRYDRRDRQYEPYPRRTQTNAPEPIRKSSDNHGEIPRKPRDEILSKQPARSDTRMSSDCLECNEKQGSRRYRLDEITEAIQESVSTLDHDFLSSKDLINEVFALRKKSQETPREAWSLARARCNPFERIGKSIFMNRAATKLAALDATFNLTERTDGKSFQFVDLCGGPGGFTEYLLWRLNNSGRSPHGYGITLKAQPGHEEVDWKIEKFRENFTQIDGADGTGNLYEEKNIREFSRIVLDRTENKGVDLVVADGGFDFLSKEEQQEHQAKQLLLCEMIAMFACLKQGGVFVCKYFDMIEEFTADMIWVLYQLFDTICITKPPTSRPASTERFIVCKGLRVFKPSKLIDRLLLLNAEFVKGDVGNFIPWSVLDGDKQFVDYLKKRNINFGTKQKESLQLIDDFVQEPHRAPLNDQEQMRRRCLSEWRLPLSAD